MAVMTNEDKGLFWNSQGGDRKYNADSLSRFISMFFNTGVMIGTLEVTPATGMSVVMDKGCVNIINPNQGAEIARVKFFDEETAFTLEMADGTSPRIDTIVIERNDNNREITAKVVTGIPAASPVPVAPVRTDTIYQLVIAEIEVAAGTTSITSGNITDKRSDATVCGIIEKPTNTVTWGTEELISGTSPLDSGTFYFVCDDE